MEKTRIENILFTSSLSSKGKGISVDGQHEIIGALPGEEVLVQVGPRKKKLKQCFLKKIITPSKERVDPRCLHFPECGGCSIQQMEYAAQLKFKQERVREDFYSLIQKYSPLEKEILGCKDPWNYRNKMEFSFSQNRSGEKFLGLMLAGLSGRVFHLNQCHLASPWFAMMVNIVRSWWMESSLRAYHHRTDGGHLRSLTLREAKQGEGKMVILTVSGNPTFALKKTEIDRFIQKIKEANPHEEISIFLRIHQITKGHPTQFFEMHLSGKDHITETLNISVKQKIFSLDFKISPSSFFQPNTLQAEKLYSAAIGELSNLSDARVLDLYCGGGTIGLSVAKFAKEVVGIELNPHSVFDAQWSKEVNQIENFSIFRGDVGKVLSNLREKKEWRIPDVVIIDPPRAGLDQKALDQLLKINSKKILSVSCHPKTQAANIDFLSKGGYIPKLIQPVDQFPHTMHIENICLLEKG